MTKDPFSKAAYESMKEYMPAMRLRIVEALESHTGPQLSAPHRGMTCEELEIELGLRHQTCSARVRELMQEGVVRQCGSRKTTSGRWARKIELSLSYAVTALVAAGTCSPAHAMGGNDFPPQVQMAIPAHPHPDPTLLEWLALIGPIGVGVAAVVGVVWEIYRRRKS